MSLKLGEIIVVAFVLLVVFSASRMSKLGNALGKFVYSFKRAANGRDTVDMSAKKPLKGSRGTDEATVIEPPSRERR